MHGGQRPLSSRCYRQKGVKIKSMTRKHMGKNCGRGLPWAVKQQPICCGKKEQIIKEQAWHVEANDVFTGDLLGAIAEILVQMMHKKEQGDKAGRAGQGVFAEDSGREKQ